MQKLRLFSQRRVPQTCTQANFCSLSVITPTSLVVWFGTNRDRKKSPTRQNSYGESRWASWRIIWNTHTHYKVIFRKNVEEAILKFNQSSLIFFDVPTCVCTCVCMCAKPLVNIVISRMLVHSGWIVVVNVMKVKMCSPSSGSWQTNQLCLSDVRARGGSSVCFDHCYQSALSTCESNFQDAHILCLAKHRGA